MTCDVSNNMLQTNIYKQNYKFDSFMFVEAYLVFTCLNQTTRLLIKLNQSYIQYKYYSRM